MAENSVSTIEKALTFVDGAMRRRLARHGLADIDHIILAIAPDEASRARRGEARLPSWSRCRCSFPSFQATGTPAGLVTPLDWSAGLEGAEPRKLGRQHRPEDVE